MSELYKAIAGSPITYLAGDISAGQTTIAVADDTALPDAPNICTIGYGEHIETIRYGSKSNGVLQDVTRGIEGTPRAWQSGTEVARFYTAYDHNAIIQTIMTHKAESALWKRVDTLGTTVVSIHTTTEENPRIIGLTESFGTNSALVVKYYAIEVATFDNFRNGQLLFFTKSNVTSDITLGAVQSNLNLRPIYIKDAPGNPNAFAVYGNQTSLSIRAVYKIAEIDLRT